MRARHVLLTYLRELRETLRDRRTLAVMVLLPLVVYPLMSILAAQVLARRATTVAEKPSRVAFTGPRPALVEAEAAVRRDARQFQVVDPPEGDVAAAIENASLDAVVTWEAPKATDRGDRLVVLFDSTRDESVKAEDRLADRLGAVLPEGCFRRYSVTNQNLATPRERGGHLLAQALPLVVVLMVMLGAFYPAIDATAGERERGTLETTFLCPVRRTDLLAGKVLAVATLAAVSGLANLFSLAFTFIETARLSGPGLVAPLPWARLVAAGSITLPAALLFSAAMVALASTARGFKEAQSLLTPVHFAVLAPSMVAALGDFSLTPAAALVPGPNLVLLARDLLLGRLALLPAALALGATLVYAALALRLAARLFDSERLLAIEDADRSARPKHEPRPITAGDAFLVYGLAVILFLATLPLQMRALIPGLLISQWGGMFGLVVVYARWKRRPLAEILGFRPAPARAWLGAALIGISAWFVVLVLTDWIAPPPKELEEKMRDMFLGQNGERPMFVTLLVVALTPAVCEEALFRGPILRALRTRLPPTSAIAFTAVLFGALHLDLYRLFPTTFLGVLLGFVAHASGSIAPAMLMHALNNGILITLASAGQDEAADQMNLGLRITLFAVACLLLGAGLVLTRSRRASSRKL